MRPPAVTVEVPPPRARRRWLPTVLAALAVVVGAELGAAALGPYLPAPDLWADAATATKVAQLDALGHEAGCVDVLLLGSSMTRDALVPARFQAADPSGRRAYNAALDAAGPVLLDRWVRHSVLPRVEVGTVVIGLASFDLNENARIVASALEAHERAPYSARGLANELEAWVIRHSALVRHRGELRDPVELVRAVRAWTEGERAARPNPDGIPGVLAADGHGLSRRALRYTGDPGPQRFVRDQLLNDFQITERSQEALARLVEGLQRRGIDVALLLLPVTDDYVAQHPAGAADQARFEAAVAAVAERTGAALVRAPSLPEEAFADTHHVNGAGADRLSDVLPGLLADADVGRRC